MGLFDFLKNPKSKGMFKSIAEASVRENSSVNDYMRNHDVNSMNEPLDKLVNGELPWGWITHNQEFISQKESPLTQYANASRNGNIDERIRVLKEMISYYENIKQEFYSKSECHRKYFQDMWEHCHNSRNDDFEYITPYKETLCDLIQNYDSLKAAEEKRISNLHKLDEKLYNFIYSHDGVLQRDIYKEFDSSVKSDIQDLLYQWDKCGKIKREKTGNTYRVSVK